MGRKRENLSQIDEERAFSHWLCNIEGIGRKGQRRLLEEAGSARAVFAMVESRLARLLQPAQMENLLRARKAGNVWEDYCRVKEKGIWYCPSCDPAFPKRLTLIPDPPVGIYVAGRLPKETLPAVRCLCLPHLCRASARGPARSMGNMRPDGLRVFWPHPG